MPEVQPEVWPIPSFHFIVNIDGYDIPFQEVSGLDTEYDVIEYRAGNSSQFQTVKMPGLKKMSDITLKKGDFSKHQAALDLFKAIYLNNQVRRTVTISLLDESQAVLFHWTLTNALIKKITGLSTDHKTGTFYLEELVLAHDGLTMTKA